MISKINGFFFFFSLEFLRKWNTRVSLIEDQSWDVTLLFETYTTEVFGSLIGPFS